MPTELARPLLRLVEEPVTDKRRASRRRQHLAVTVALLRGAEQQAPTAKLPAEAFDLSRTGTGLRITDRNDLLRGLQLAGRYVRLQLAAPGITKPLVVTAEIRWCRAADRGNPGGPRVGVEFLDPTPEFLQAVDDVLATGKGDQQYLWNLWDSLTVGL
jgi:hypothetical protein